MTIALGSARAGRNPRPPTYASDSTWLCLPGRMDVCSTPLATTALNPNGYGSTGRSSVAKDPPVDCFYVYPTVSRDSGLNSDMRAGADERIMAETQFARFASVCRPFAPIYRQMTVASIAAYATGTDVSPGRPARLSRRCATPSANICVSAAAGGRSSSSATARAA